MKYNTLNVPNFIVIGAPKSGTTSLYYYLKQHPDIFLPYQKELHYFSYKEISLAVNGPGDRNNLDFLCKRQQDYHTHYAGVKGERAIGDISPSYLYYSNSAQRIRNELGNVKIIAILRNPSDRAYSQYMHLVREYRETLDFIDALSHESERIKDGWSDIWRYRESSLYAKRVERFINEFGRENVKILIFGEFIRNRMTVVRDVLRFLGVDSKVQLNTASVLNRGGCSRSRFITNLTCKNNKLKSLLRKIVPAEARFRLNSVVMNLNTGPKPKMSDEARSYLDNYFYDDIKRLEYILNIHTGWI